MGTDDDGTSKDLFTFTKDDSGKWQGKDAYSGSDAYLTFDVATNTPLPSPETLSCFGLKWGWWLLIVIVVGGGLAAFFLIGGDAPDDSGDEEDQKKQDKDGKKDEK